MKKWIKEIIVTALIVIVASSAIGYFRSYSVKTNLQILENLETINHKKVKEILAQKKPLILVFWGTWCPVCNQEVSSFSILAKRDDVVLLTVASNSGSNEDIKRYMQKKGANYNVINDKDGKLMQQFGISVFPTVIYFNSNRDKTIKDSGFTSYAGFSARVKLIGY